MQFKTQAKQILKYLTTLYNNVKRTELHADFMSGYYTGCLKISDANYPAAIVPLTHYDLGDNDSNSHDHHGTPEERASAVQEGFDAGFVKKLPLKRAAALALTYVQAIKR
jgi:predicted metalloprotease